MRARMRTYANTHARTRTLTQANTNTHTHNGHIPAINGTHKQFTTV